jgi:hydrogenase expression/formation protein HypE
MKKIVSGHGGGGGLMKALIKDVIHKHFGSDLQLDDSALLNIPPGKTAFTTDTFTITPIFFPGGDIGSLAVNGTVNDLASMGADPLYLSCALILEEEFPIEDLEKILSSMRRAADIAGVKIVTGDTKVVPKGKGDKIYINTAGIGLLKGEPARSIPCKGDRIILSGTAGDHGITIMAARNSLPFTSSLKSDCASLNRMTKKVFSELGSAVKFMRDPTRGGVASVLNEVVDGMPFGAVINENAVPVRDEVRGISSLLGIDPLYSANEGKMIFIISAESCDRALEIIRSFPEGADAAVIGAIDESSPGRVLLETPAGGRRILPLLTDEQLPRIC